MLREDEGENKKKENRQEVGDGERMKVEKWVNKVKKMDLRRYQDG